MTHPSLSSRPNISFLVALLAGSGAAACGAAPVDEPPSIAISPSDAGTTPTPGDEAGTLPAFEAGAWDAAANDGAAQDGSSGDSATNEGGAVEAGACPTGQADCDGDPSNGCETSISSDAKNCGACGHDCTALPNVSGAGVTCNAGVCNVPASACASGFGHCSSNPNDGCEANLASAQTCGTCSVACTGSTPDCTPTGCSNGCGAATPTSCSGSCVDTTSNTSNCGACGNACPAPAGGSATCATSTCGFDCNSGFHTCGATCADNTSVTTCGSSCTPCPAPANSVASCTTAETCTFTCDTGFHTCDGATCSSSASTATCGASCTPCAAPPSNGTATCDGTSCGLACDAGYHACGGNSCDSNTSTGSCGASCTPCVTPANATATCNGTACGFTCNAGYADCDGNAANGCEVNLSDDGNNCRTCGHSCLGGMCASNACQPIELASVANPSFVALDSARVYFLYVPSAGTSFGAISKTGGGVASTHITVDPLAMIVDGATLYEIDSSDIEGIATSLIGTGTLTQTTYDASISAASGGQWLAAPNGRPYWSSNDRRSIATTTATMGPSGPLAQYALTAPTNGQVRNIVGTTDGFLAWNECVGTTCSITVGTPTCNLEGACSLTGTAIRSATSSANIYVDATYAYIQDGGTLTTVVRASGTVVQSVATASTSGSGLVVDGPTAYWMYEGAINSVPVAGGAATVVAPGSSPYAFAIDSAALYWTTGTTNGAVMKLAR